MNKIIYHALCVVLMLVRLLGVAMFSWGALVAGLEDDDSYYRACACLCVCIGAITYLLCGVASSHLNSHRSQKA